MNRLTKSLRMPGGALRIAVIILVALTVGIAVSESPRPAAAPLSDGLVASLDGAYDIRPDDGLAYVQWNTTLVNTGPAPWRPADDPLNHPTEIEVFVPAGFSNFVATGANGNQYAMTFEDLGYGSMARVQLGYAMAYGDAITIDFSYTLSSSTDSYILISPRYVYIEAYAGLGADSYDNGSLTITLPTKYAADAAFEFATCDSTVSGENTIFSCIGDYGLYAGVEIIDEDSRISVSNDLDINGRNVDFILRYWSGDEAWADKAERLMNEVLPIYADIFGAPYAGPSTIRLTEKGGSELYGNLGLAYCQNTICALAATPAADDQVILHEISHMWSNPFDNRWLTEGIAEYVSLKAAAMLGIPGYEDFSDPLKAPQATSRAWRRPEAEITATEPDFSLDPWGGRFGIDDIFISPGAGYSWGARFWQEIEISHGPEPFQKVMSEIQWKVPDGTIDSEAVMDLLEDSAGVKADDLFKSFIFPEDRHTILDKRRAARDRLDALRSNQAESAPELDTAVFAPIQEAILDWRFDAALDSIEQLEASLNDYVAVRVDLEGFREDAEAAGLSYPFPWEEGNRTWEINTEIVHEFDAAYEAMAAYLAAEAVVDEPRGFFQKVGLLGKDDRAELDEAAGHFAWARFDQSIEHSAAAEKMIENSHSDGVMYSIVLAIVAGSMVIFAATVYVISRQQETAGVTGSEAKG